MAEKNGKKHNMEKKSCFLLAFAMENICRYFDLKVYNYIVLVLMAFFLQHLNLFNKIKQFL